MHIKYSSCRIADALLQVQDIHLIRIDRYYNIIIVNIDYINVYMQRSEIHQRGR